MELAIGRLLRQRNMKQADLVRETGLTKGYISSLVSGRKQPSHEALEKIANALSASPAELFETPIKISSPAIFEGFNEDEVRFVTQPEAKLDKEATAQLDFGASHPSQLIVGKSIYGLAILAGDILHIDLSDKNPNGRIAITTRADTDTGNAVTLVRRMNASTVFPSNPLEQPCPLSGDGYSFAVIGTVVGAVRNIEK